VILVAWQTLATLTGLAFTSSLDGYQSLLGIEGWRHVHGCQFTDLSIIANGYRLLYRTTVRLVVKPLIWPDHNLVGATLPGGRKLLFRGVMLSSLGELVRVAGFQHSRPTF